MDISVFFVDIDSVFMKNPVPILKQYSNIDFATQQEHDSNGTTHVSGLMLVHATPKSIQIFEETAKQQKGQKLKPDQDILNSVIQHHVSNLTIREFEQSNFSDGRTYFLERKCCQFVTDACCHREDLVILHNNWNGADKWQKIYRFQEQLMWFVNSDRYCVPFCSVLFFG